jgi:outer membrane protein assembly factor BamB
VNRDGFFVDGAFTEASASAFARDTTFAGTIAGNVYASPLYVEDGPQHKGAVYIATESNNVYALDEGTGAVVWQKSMGTAPKNTGAGCGNISPIGITGTPAIDLGTRLIVFSAASDDGTGNIATHIIHALSIDDGTEKWSVDVSTLKDPTGLAFNPQPQNQRSAVLIVGGIAYVAFGGHYGDCGDYHGWVVGAPLTGTGAKAWATQVGGAGIWGPGGPSSDGQSIYVTTGNGFGSGATWQESEGVFRLDPGPSFTQQSADYFAPSDWSNLDQGDIDLSGSQPLVLDAPGMSPTTLVMAQGKDGNLYLLDRTDLGGVGAAKVGTLNVLSGQISNAGASATVGGTTYVVVRPNGGGSGVGCPNGTSGDLVAVKLDPGAAQKMSVVWCADGKGEGSPIITTSDGTKDAVVWAAGAESSNQVLGWDLATGTLVFKGGAAGDKLSAVRHFTTPMVAHGRIFVAGDNEVFAFKP